MKAIVKREFRALMLSVRGIVFLGVFLLAAGIFTVLYNINAAIGNFEIAISYLVPVLVLTLPLVSADAFALDHEKGTDRVLSLLPVRTRDVVLGKYLARLCVLGIPTAVLILYPLILDLYGSVSYLTAYVSLLALFLIGAILLALGMWISAVAKSFRYALAWSYIVFAIWYAAGILCGFVPTSPMASLIALLILGVLVGLVLMLWTKKWVIAIPITLVLEAVPTLLFLVARERLVGAFGWLMTFLSPFRAFDDFVFGVLDFGILVTYGLWIAVFLLLSVIRYGKSGGTVPLRFPKTHFLRRTSEVALSLCVLGGMVIGLVGMALLPHRVGRIDLTKERSYTLSAETKAFLGSLESDVTIYVLNPDRTDRRFEMFLDTMTGYSKHLSVKEVNTADEPTFLTEHALVGTTVTPYSLVIAGKDREQFIAYENLFSFSNATLGVNNMTLATYQYYLYTFQSSEQYSDYLSALLTDTVQYFEGETLISLFIEYAAAHEIPTVYLLEGYGTSVSQSMVAYVMASLGTEYRTLTFGDMPVVPHDASSLVLAKPEKDLSTAEAETLRAYLQGGGQLTVLTDESNLDMPNLCSLLAEYGLSATKGALTETVESTEEGKEATETTTLTVTPNFQHDMLADYADKSDFSVTVTGANAISYPQNPAGSLIITPLLTTTTQSYVAGNPDAKASYAVAVAAETAEGARVAWFTGADSFLGNMEQTPTAEAINNALCVMLSSQWSTKQYQSSITPAAHKPYTAEWMTVSSGASGAWSVIFILLVPAAAVSFGIVTRYQRKKAK